MELDHHQSEKGVCRLGPGAAAEELESPLEVLLRYLRFTICKRDIARGLQHRTPTLIVSRERELADRSRTGHNRPRLRGSPFQPAIHRESSER